MEFNCNIEQLLHAYMDDGIAIIDSGDTGKLSKKGLDMFSLILNTIGELSSKAQQLKSTITTSSKFLSSDNQRIFLKCEGNQAIGFLKVGKKNLFIRNEAGNIKEISPLCVLDFYVYEGCQRSGYGKLLFMKMLDYEGTEARKLAYDRPSQLLMKFLKKYFNLTEYVPQNNNFVVFNDYFSEPEADDYNENQNGNEIYTSNGGNGYTKEEDPDYNNAESDIAYSTKKNANSHCNAQIVTSYAVPIKKDNTPTITSTQCQPQSNNPPWATSDTGSTFISSSSAYGAFVHRKKNII